MQGVESLRWVCLRTPIARLRGLLGRPAPAAHEVWCLPRCGGVHTWGMSYAIDLVFIDAAGCIVRCDSQVPPWRFRWHPRAVVVWEMAAGALAPLGWQEGQRIGAAPCFSAPCGSRFNSQADALPDV